MRAVAALTLAALVAACRGSEPGAAPPPPPPPPPAAPETPTELVAQELGYARFQLSWTPHGSWSYFEIEASQDGGPFERVTDGAGAPLRWYETSLAVVDSEAAELRRYDFRVRAALGAEVSGWSAIAVARAGILPVTGLTAELGVGPDGTPAAPITVRWTHPSTIDVEVAVERRILPFTAVEPGGWTPIAAGDSSAIDPAPVDGASYGYRVRRGRDGRWSEWTEAGAYYPVLAPVDVRVTPVVDDAGEAVAFRVTWTNRSVVADGVAVWRTSEWTGPVASLPRDATSYVDHFPAWASWRYRVEATLGEASWMAAQSAIAEAPPYLARGDRPIQAGVVELPCATPLRYGDGRWACTVAAGTEVAFAWQDPDGAWQQRVVPTSPGRGLYRALDGSGTPHFLETHSLEPITRYVRWDGTGWHVEDVPLPGLDPTQTWNTWPRVVGFGVSDAGAPLVLVERGWTWAETYGVLSRTEGGWTERPIQVRSGLSFFELQRFAVAPDGTAVLFGNVSAPDANLCAMASLAPEDAQADLETIAGTDMACFGAYKGVLLGTAPGRAAIAYALERESGEYDWYYRERGAWGWSEPELVATQPFSRRVIPPAGTLSRDGTRAALLLSWPMYWYADPQMLKAFARDPRGGWSELTLGPGFPDSGRFAGSGFLGDGRMWLLGTDELSYYGPPRYALYEEL